MQKIALGKARIALGALAVELHALEADVFLRERGGQERDGFGEEAVEPLARVIFRDLEFFHGGHPRFRWFFDILARGAGLCKAARGADGENAKIFEKSAVLLYTTYYDSGGMSFAGIR